MNTSILSISIFVPMENRQLLDLTMRLGIAVVTGGSIGLDRYLHHKSAGIRTHMLVSLGSALFTLVPFAVGDLADMASLTRIIQGIAAGVGFLGAGEILHRSNATTPVPGNPVRVTGLTSAASIWVTAAIGVISGCGLWQLAIVATVMTLSILTGLKYLERSNRN
jgi:putative Mg2+ transporter-C (MgtC) family protein